MLPAGHRASWRTTCAPRSPRGELPAVDVGVLRARDGRGRAGARAAAARARPAGRRGRHARSPRALFSAGWQRTGLDATPDGAMRSTPPAPPARPRPPRRPAGRAASAAKLTVGIGENNPGMFTRSAVLAAGRQARPRGRLLQRRSTSERRRARPRAAVPRRRRRRRASRRWSRSSTRRGDATICNKQKNRKKAQCRLPTAKAVRARRSSVQGRASRRCATIVPWNEINHFTQPTSRSPKAAARFTKIARKVFKGCTVRRRRHARPGQQHEGQAPEVPLGHPLRQAVPQGSTGASARSAASTTTRTSTASARRGTKAIIKALGCKQTGSPRSAGSTSSRASRRPQKRQLKATKFMFKVATQDQEDQAAVRLHLVRRRDVALRRRPGGRRQGPQGVRRGPQARQVVGD